MRKKSKQTNEINVTIKNVFFFSVNFSTIILKDQSFIFSLLLSIFLPLSRLIVFGISTLG